MSKKFTYFVLIFLTVLVAGPLFAAEYWLSMTLAKTDTPGSTFGGPKVLIKIDSLGNLIIPPTKVVPNSMGYRSPPAGATALSQTSTHLYMWIPTSRRDRDNPAKGYPIFKAVIEKQNLKLISLKEQKIDVTNNYVLQATQRSVDNFLAMESFDIDGEVSYLGVPLSSDSKISGPTFGLSSEQLTCSCEMAISANGRFLFFLDQLGNAPGKLVIQRLTPKGHPIGKRVVVTQGRATVQDISNIVSGNRRMVLYSADIIHPKLYLQNLKADTLEKIGSPIRIATNTGYGLQTAVVDPSGHFILYGAGSTLFFQALDVTGQRSGPPKPIADIVGYGFNILKDN